MWEQATGQPWEQVLVQEQAREPLEPVSQQQEAQAWAREA